MIAVGGLGLSIGSLLPWGSLLGVTERGTASADGWFALIAGVVLVVVGYTGYRGGKAMPAWLGWAAVVVGAGLAYVNYSDIRHVDGLEVGIGMPIMLAGSVLALVGLLLERRSHDEAALSFDRDGP